MESRHPPASLSGIRHLMPPLFSIAKTVDSCTASIIKWKLREHMSLQLGTGRCFSHAMAGASIPSQSKAETKSSPQDKKYKTSAANVPHWRTRERSRAAEHLRLPPPASLMPLHTFLKAARDACGCLLRLQCLVDTNTKHPGSARRPPQSGTLLGQVLQV